MRVLFVENEDSFSWNVIDALPFERAAVDVRPGVDHAGAKAALAGADALVIGPGPTDPIRAGLVDLVTLAAERQVPTLGICLGHQAIGLAFGANLARVTPCHGKRSPVELRPSRLFPGIDGTHTAMRYHSLALTNVTAPLRSIARTLDGIVMGIEHESLPMAGLQFHPDSFGTSGGRAMLAAFFGAVA